MRAYRLAYDGADYRGFQRQPHGDTVEDAVLDALRALDVLDEDADVPPGYAAAGRTDAGVSAVAQTVAFEAPAWLSPAALSGELPADVRAWAAAEVPADFHATHDATRRTYEYHLYAPRAPDASAGGAPAGDDDSGPPPADDALAHRACAALSGERDVHNLTPDDAGTERDLEVVCSRDGDYLVVTVAAGGFPRQFVRRAVSLVRDVATGARDPSFVDRVLSDERLDGPDGVAPAPPQPLVLADVTYPGLSFEVDDRAAASARAVFEDRRVRRQTGARVAGRLRSGVRDGRG